VRAAAVSVWCAEQCAQGATAAPAFGARPADRRDLVGRRRSAGDGIGHHLAGNPVTQADEHRAGRLLVDPHHVGELADEHRRIRAHPGSVYPRGRGVGMVDPTPGAVLVVELLQDHDFVAVVEGLE
jgi:hypothetical protein